MKILLTGCAGFIGSHVLDRLLSEGHQVVGIDNFDSCYPRAIKERNIAQHCNTEAPTAAFSLLESDLTDKATFTELDRDGPTQFDAIIHLAGKGCDRASIKNPSDYTQANIVSTQNLLEYAKDNQIPQFIHASSSSVYGVNPKTPWLESDTQLQPISPYAFTKISSEHLGHVYSQLYSIRFVTLRLPTVYGPRQRPNQAIHTFASNISHETAIVMHGDGNTRRDYTYIDDIVDGIVAALKYQATPYEVINLGSNQLVELQEVIAQLEHTLAVQFDIEQLPEQEGDVPHTLISTAKAARLLGYAPSTSFEDGIAHFAKWMRRMQAISATVTP